MSIKTEYEQGLELIKRIWMDDEAAIPELRDLIFKLYSNQRDKPGQELEEQKLAA